MGFSPERALDAVYRHLGAQAMLTGANAPGGPVTAIVRRPDAEIGGALTARAFTATLTAEVRVEEAMAALGREPRDGDVLTIGGVAHTVKGKLRSDALGLIWDLDLQ